MTAKSSQDEISPSEITPEWLYMSRRRFLQVAAVAGVAAALAACKPLLGSSEATPVAVTNTSPVGRPNAEPGAALKDELTPYDTIINYNNYYEFSMDKDGVAPLVKNFKTSPWTVQVYGLVNNPQTYSVEDLIQKFPPQERIYRLRCVEGWSMVIPWQGFPLGALLKEVDPNPEAKFVRFETVLRPSEMVGQNDPSFPWPYQEGLRLDEAMNDLAILATGMYGKPLPVQDGAPIRLVVPWKYGFKSIKAIVKIELVAEQPSTEWSTIAPEEYGFYANVNPDVPHPRWSQSSERRIGELKRRPTLLFNGYGDQVASLYTGMDLRKYY